MPAIIGMCIVQMLGVMCEANRESEAATHGAPKIVALCDCGAASPTDFKPGAEIEVSFLTLHSIAVRRQCTHAIMLSDADLGRI